MIPGTRVRLTAAYKAAGRLNEHMVEHIDEFDECVGTVLGPVDWGNGVILSDIDVRWDGCNTRFVCGPEDLEVV